MRSTKGASLQFSSPPGRALGALVKGRGAVLWIALLPAAACQGGATTRVDPPSRIVERAPQKWSAPPPAPQLMVSEPTVVPFDPASPSPQITLPPVEAAPPAEAPAPSPAALPAPERAPSDTTPAPSSSGGARAPKAVVTEEQRNAAFRAYVGAPRTYAPAPAPRVVDRIAERVVYHDVRPIRYSHRSRYHEPFGSTLARTAVYTGLGAIIGHQYRHRGRGAAIGAGLALLTSPWGWYDDCDHRWDDRCDWDY